MPSNESTATEGNVAEVLSKTQLIITPGKNENIKVGDTFQIVADEMDQVRDPHADRVLEEIPVIKATVKVLTVYEKCSLVQNTATRTEQRTTGLGALMTSSAQTRQVTLVEELRVGGNTMNRVDRTIKVGDRCVKI